MTCWFFYHAIRVLLPSPKCYEHVQLELATDIFAIGCALCSIPESGREVHPVPDFSTPSSPEVHRSIYKSMSP